MTAASERIFFPFLGCKNPQSTGLINDKGFLVKNGLAGIRIQSIVNLCRRIATAQRNDGRTIEQGVFRVVDVGMYGGCRSQNTRRIWSGVIAQFRRIFLVHSIGLDAHRKLIHLILQDLAFLDTRSASGRA